MSRRCALRRKHFATFQDIELPTNLIALIGLRTQSQYGEAPQVCSNWSAG
jgi:hypothetical protein